MALSANDILREQRKWRQRVVDEVGAGGGSGVWTLIDETDISGSPANHEITWDESLYNEIKVKISGVQPATDGVSFYVIVGHTNGGTMINSTNDYDGTERLYETAGSPSALADSDQVRLLASCSNAANETINGDLLITAFDGSDLGCIIRAELLYINSASNQRAHEVRAFTDDGIGAAIDTYRLYWASGNFANTGTIRTWGLGA